MSALRVRAFGVMGVGGVETHEVIYSAISVGSMRNLAQY